MRIYLLVITSLFMAACKPQIDADRIVIIENITAIDGINGQRDRVNIVVIDDEIQSITPNPISATLLKKSKGNHTRIDGTGRYLIPGLWDAHVHLTYHQDIGHEVFFPLSISHGVTALRDTGGHIENLIPAIEAAAQDATSPDLFFSGPLLDGKRRIYDGSSDFFPDLSVGLGTAEEARTKVDELAQSGVHFLKAYEMLQPEVFAAITDQAQKYDLPVASHIPLSMTAMDAIEMGTNDMQHMRNLEFACSDNVSELAASRRNALAAVHNIVPNHLRSQIHAKQRTAALTQQNKSNCDRILETLVENDVYQTPTLTISRFFTRRLFAEDRWVETFSYMPKSVAEGWRTRSSALLDTKPDDTALAHDQWILDILKDMGNVGAPIMAGTDAPIAFLTPGASLQEEMIMMVEAGISPIDVLKAATYTPARFLGLELDRGTIAKGMKADLVILSNNPLEDISHIRDIHSVIKDGHVLDRKELDRRLQLAAKL